MLYFCRPVVQRRDDQRRTVASDESESQVHVHRRETALCHGRPTQRADHAADDQRGAAHAAEQCVHCSSELGVVSVNRTGQQSAVSPRGCHARDTDHAPGPIPKEKNNIINN